MPKLIRGLFLTNGSIFNNKASGIYKKMQSQLEAMNRNGLSCEFYAQRKKKDELPEILNIVGKYFPWGNIAPVWENIENIEDVNFLYFRRPNTIYKPMLNAIIEYKQRNPFLKVFMEIPTYPYDLVYMVI